MRDIAASHAFEENSSATSTGRSRAYSWYVAAMLSMLAALAQIDKQAPFILAEKMATDLHLSDTQLGVIGGVAFSLFFTLACLPIAVLADRTSRKWVIVSAVAVWSCMTASSGWARGFFELFLARIGVAVGEAGGFAPSQSLISDYFGPGERAAAMSLFTFGSTLGVMAGFAGGGWVADNFGWRTAFMVLGLPGMALAVLMTFTLRELPRQVRPPSVGKLGSLRRLFAKRTYLFVVVAMCLLSLGINGIFAWSPPLLIRSFGLSTAQAGLILGLLVGLAGGFGTLVSGWLADRLGRRDRRWHLTLPAHAMFAAAPIMIAAIWSPILAATIVCMAIALPLLTGAVPIFYAVAQDLSPSRDRVFAAAFLVFASNLVGGGIAPVLIGFLSDLLQPLAGDMALKMGLTVVMGFSALGGFACLAGTASLSADLELGE